MLTLESLEIYVTWHGKKDFADEIKGVYFEMGVVSWVTQVVSM